MLNGFIDKGTDDILLQYLQKSISPEILEKALDKTKLVQKEIQVQTKHGIEMRKQWVKAGEEESSQPNPHKEEESQERKKAMDEPDNSNAPNEDEDGGEETEYEEPATPWNITDGMKHLVPLESLDDLPQHLKDLGKPIPKAWRLVMVSPDPNADLQVIGKDSKNREQRWYSKAHDERTSAEKFERVRDLMEHREKIDDIISNLKNKDTADCLKLILATGLRPGSTKDTKAKVEAIGATTLRGEHVVEENGKVYLRFTGKKGVHQDHQILDEDIAKMLLERKEKAGDKGDLFGVSNKTLCKALEPLGVSPKDFRTMLATTTAKNLLESIPPETTVKGVNKVRKQVSEIVCSLLGNEPAQSLKSYIDPKAFEDWSPEGMKAWMEDKLKREEDNKKKREAKKNKPKEDGVEDGTEKEES